MSLKNAVKAKQSRSSQQKEGALQEVTKEPSKRLNVNVPESLLRDFKVKATADDRDMSSLVTEWIKTYLDK